MEEDKQLSSAAPSPESSSESIQPETQESQSSSQQFMTQPQQLSTQPLTQYQETTTTNANNDDISYTQLKYTQQESAHFSYSTQPTTQPFTNTQQMTQPAALRHEPQLGSQSQDDNNIDSQSLSQDQPITQPLTQVFNNSTTTNTDDIDNGSCDSDSEEHLHESEQDIVEMMVFQNDFIGNSQQNIDDVIDHTDNNVDLDERIDNNESTKEIMGFDYGMGEKQAVEQSSLLVEEQKHDNVLGMDSQPIIDETKIDDIDTSKPEMEQPTREARDQKMPTKQPAMLINVPDDATGKTPCLSQQPDDDDNIENGNTVAPSLPPPPPPTTTTTTPHQKQNTVTNPYTKKRSIDQISQRSNSTNSSGSGGTNSSSTADQKQQVVFNPYAKSKKQNPKSSVRNPYARMNNGSGASSPKPPRSTSPKPPPRSTSPKPPPSTTVPKTQQQHPPIPQLAAFKQPPSIAPVASPKQPTFRRAGISISLPMAERLPSRNVSYQPAEILSVGELYRYLYLTGEEEEDIEQQEQSSSTERGISKELISVRITGTLLCVASSNVDTINGSKGKLYDSGTYLLLGDPLENTRFMKKEALPQAQQSDPLSAASDPKTALKPGLTSILRKKITSTLSTASSETSASVKPTPALKSTQSNLSRQQKEKEQTLMTTTATPAVEESTSINRESTTTVDNMRKPSTTRGILNTKKRLSFGGGGLGGGGGKRLSFGGKGLGGGKGSVGGGLVGSRKFQTPKRINTTGPLSSVKKNSTTNNRIGGLTTSTVKKSVYSSAKSVGSGKNPRPEYIIQCHPSPTVPVWIGSFYNGDGLDGSVIGDLVMIMGELVIEHCASCQASRAASRKEGEEREEEGCTDNRPQHSAQSQQQGVRGAANSIAASASQISGASSIPQSQTPSRRKLKGRTFCCQCTRFLRARLVKNANGTDMNLQREALKARREYLIERKRQMKMLIPNSTTTSNQSSNSVYSVGCGTHCR